MTEAKPIRMLTLADIHIINGGNIAATDREIWRALHEYDDPQVDADDQATIAKLFRTRYANYARGNGRYLAEES
jgi:hypothetical protein